MLLVEAEVQDVEVNRGPQVVNVGDEAEILTLQVTVTSLQQGS